jgi:hypothetical protein
MLLVIPCSSADRSVATGLTGEIAVKSPNKTVSESRSPRGEFELLLAFPRHLFQPDYKYLSGLEEKEELALPRGELLDVKTKLSAEELLLGL